MEILLRTLVPRIIPGMHAEYRTLAGKSSLLRNLPDRLRGYSPWVVDAGVGVVIVLDRDDDDRIELRARVDRMVDDAGMQLDTQRGPGTVLVRVVVEELESWLLGDVKALREEFPRISSTLAEREKFRAVDAISGGTWEALEKVLQDTGYHPGGLGKLECTARVAPHMDVEGNRSPSFAAFRDGLRRLTGVA